jgi:hypothetical protein
VTTPLNALTDTWNSGSTVFTAIQMNVTNIASADGSAFFDGQISGSSAFRIGRAANNTTAVWMNQSGPFTGQYAQIYCDSSGYLFLQAPTTPGAIHFATNGGWGTVTAYPGGTIPGLRMSLSCGFGWTLTHGGDNLDTSLFRDAAGIMAQRTGANPQTFRLYNTFTDAANYERGVFDWNTTANALTIGAQAAGTGTLRAVKLIGSDITIKGDTATPAGGSTAARLLFGTTAGFGIYYGSGAPTVSAAAGSLYIRTDNAGASLRLYSNTSGSTTWAAITSA